MKKIFSIILSLVLISLIAAPLIALAQTTAKECCEIKRSYSDLDGACKAGSIVGPEGGSCIINDEKKNITCKSKDWGTICLMETVYNVTDWIFYIILSIAVVIGVVSGFMFMTSGGDPTKIKSARDLLTYMAIGLVVAALAKVIPSIVRTMVGV